MPAILSKLLLRDLVKFSTQPTPNIRSNINPTWFMNVNPICIIKMINPNISLVLKNTSDKKKFPTLITKFIEYNINSSNFSLFIHSYNTLFLHTTLPLEESNHKSSQNTISTKTLRKPRVWRVKRDKIHNHQVPNIWVHYKYIRTMKRPSLSSLNFISPYGLMEHGIQWFLEKN